MTGSFQLDNSVITFRDLTFGVPGADVQLEGSYDLNADALDFHGALKLEGQGFADGDRLEALAPQTGRSLPL